MKVSSTPDAATASRVGGLRVMVSLVDGCRVAIPLDSVEATYDLNDTSGGKSGLPERDERLPQVDWREITGVTWETLTARKRTVVVRTPGGPIAFTADAALGIRSLSFTANPPMPTRLRDRNGAPLCFLLLLDGQPYFLLDPRALQRAATGEPTWAPELPGTMWGQ